MRSTYPLAAVFALGLAVAFFAGSGFNGLVVGEQETSVYDTINDQENKSSAAQGNFSASRSGDDEGSIVGFVVGGARSIVKFATLVGLLPLTLVDIGFPKWFAYPVGTITNILLSIGLIQFVTGRILK